MSRRLRVAVHDLPRRVDDVPLGAELLDVLPLGGPGAGGGVVGVERVVVVGDLLAAALARRRAEQRRLQAGARVRLADGQHRRPDLRAGAGARALAALVLLEHVERALVAVDDDLAELADLAEA